jgi:hypothetical protein
MPEVQSHGKIWELDLATNVYGATLDELKAIKYTSAKDLPSTLNRLDAADLSIKTTQSANAVCMADCLRVYDSVSSDKPIHMTVILYTHDDATHTKRLVSITEVKLTGSAKLLFGSLTRDQLVTLDTLVKAVPQKRSPTQEEHAALYAYRNTLQAQSGAIHLDIKCNSQQSRLQCSFNHFQDFLKTYPERIIASSTTGDFRGKKVVTQVLNTQRRVFKKQKSTL